MKLRFWIPAFLLTPLVVYLLSSGPVVAFYWNRYGGIPEKVVNFYSPVSWVHESSKPIGSAIDWYTHLWFQKEKRTSDADPSTVHSHGNTRFELLGMLDEYGGRPLEKPASIESFYPAEATPADHFQKLLGEFCAEESLPNYWFRTQESGGHIDFIGKRIAASINRSYVADNRYGFGTVDVCVLAPDVLRSATKADMLRYITGAYMRFGDYQSAHRAFFSTANNYSKCCVLVDFLSRLGCDDIRFYDDHEAMAVPTTCVLTFKPTAEVKSAAGVRQEVTPEELKALFRDSLKEQKLPHLL